jgi:magnesium transporter
MFKTRRPTPGASPATLLPHLVDGQAIRPRVQVMEYDKDYLREREIHSLAELDSQPFRHGVTWINVDGLGDVELLKELGHRFNLHPLTLEDVLTTGQRPKYEVFPDFIFIVAQMAYQVNDSDIRSEQVSLFFGKNFLITLQEEPEYDAFNPIRERIRAGRGLMRKSGSDYLAYAMLDSLIDHYYPVLESLGTDIEELEDELLKNPSREMVHTLHDYKRNLTQLRRLVWPLRDVVNSLLHDSSGYVAPSTKVFLRDCYDHTIQLMELVESYKEVTSSLMDLYHSSVSLRTNEVMRVLTVITSIFIPLTFIVGIYGMNFAPENHSGGKLPLNMPELYHPLGYIGVMAVMGLIAVIQLLIFRKMKWL